MIIERNFSIKKYNTFGLDYKTDSFVTVKSEEEASEAIINADRSKPLLIVGHGSNLLFVSDFPGTIIHPEIVGTDTLEQNGDHIIISAGAGETWDDVVGWSVGKGFGGIENLSLIPGTVGATPVQNIGAYGTEVKESIFKVRAISLTDGKPREFSNSECKFGYRDSIFKLDLKGKYLITKVFYRLNMKPGYLLGYGSLKDEVLKLGPVTLKTVREAVISIRRSKLPDPAEKGNAGSFFRNPVITIEKASRLEASYPGIPLYDDPSGGKKVAAGWLIEQCGWKGRRKGGAGVHKKQALVIVNHGNATGREIFELSESVRASVAEKFGIELVREVEIAETI
jgi:UDP-N-acetylmuramate dehydrogenase